MAALLIRDYFLNAAYYMGEILLFQLKNANLQEDLVDQIFQKMFSGVNYDFTRVYIRQRSGFASGGGTAVIYDQINQTGNQLFNINFSALSASSSIVGLPSTPSGAVPLMTNIPFFEVTSVTITPCLADIEIYGHDVT